MREGMSKKKGLQLLLKRAQGSVRGTKLRRGIYPCVSVTLRAIPPGKFHVVLPQMLLNSGA